MEAKQLAEDDTFQFCGQKVLIHTNDKKNKEKKSSTSSNSKISRLWGLKKKKSSGLNIAFHFVKMVSENTMNFSNPPGIPWNKTSTELRFFYLNILISHLHFTPTSILIANIYWLRSFRK